MPFLFESNELQTRVLIDRIKHDECFMQNVVAKPINLTGGVLQDITSMQTSKKDQDHRKYIFFGPSGEGKSASMLWLAYKLYPKLDLKKCLYYEYSKALDNLSKLEEGSVLLIDEKPTDSGPGSYIEAQEFNNLAEQCRDYSLSILACANTQHDFQYHYGFEALFGFIDTTNHICRMAVHNTENRVIGFCDFEFIGDHNKKIWEEYLVIKKAHGKTRMKKDHTSRWEERLIFLKNFKRKGDKQTLIAKLKPKYTNSEGIFKIPQKICFEIVDQAYPSWHRDIRAHELAAKLYFDITMETL